MRVANIKLPKGSATNKPFRIVLHSMAEFIDTEDPDYFAVNWLDKLGFSAHAFITPSGVVIRSRKDTEGAYHAKGHNTNTLGVEFLVGGLHTYESFLAAIKTDYLTKAQYSAGLELVRGWQKEWNIPRLNVVMHSDISPGRKFDPGQGFVDSGFLDEL